MNNTELSSSDPKALKIINKKNKNIAPMNKFRNSIAHFLIDFNVVPTSIAFLIAFVFRDFFNSLTHRIVHIFIPKTIDDLIDKFITLIITLILSVLFVKYIFYGLFHNNQIIKEVAIKKAVEKKRENKALKSINI